MDALGGRWRVGTAGWQIPRESRAAFAGSGTHLQRYACRFSCVEINSTFYRPHRPSTYARWAESVPEGFRFALKLPKAITHELRLRDAGAALEAFLTDSASLGPKRDVVLVQLPPSLAFEPYVAEQFFTSLRAQYGGRIACEPRHVTWFGEAATDLFERFACARVAADPPVEGQELAPGGSRAFAYWRLHGAPRTYYSAYERTRLSAVATAIARNATPAWCILDNTALGAASADALTMLDLLASCQSVV